MKTKTVYPDTPIKLLLKSGRQKTNVGTSSRGIELIQDRDVKMITMASQITSLAIVYSTVYSGAG